MAKDPARRFQTATEVAELLARCLAHVQQPLACPLPPGLELRQTPPDPRRPFRPSRAAMVASATLILATGAIAFLALANDVQPRPRPDLVRTRPDGRAVAHPVPGPRQVARTSWIASLFSSKSKPTRSKPTSEGAIPLLALTLSPSAGYTLRRWSEAVAREILADRPAPTGVTDSLPNPDDRR